VTVGGKKISIYQHPADVLVRGILSFKKSSKSTGLHQRPKASKKPKNRNKLKIATTLIVRTTLIVKTTLIPTSNLITIWFMN
jgi:hypothetical protein